MNKMSEERDWIDEEMGLTVIYVRRGYSKAVAESMAQREIEKRKIEYGYPVDTEEKVTVKTKEKKGDKKNGMDKIEFTE